MARAIWKGAISFGLVHIPVSLVSATSASGVDFDWLDERTMDPVGYKRVNKVTGKEVASEHIVKGVQFEKGSYVVISDDEIKAALPEATQTIDIFSFIDSADIPLLHISKPYFLAPDKRGEKVYALLRETLISTGKVALAHVVVRTKQSLAALMPLDSALALIMLRSSSQSKSTPLALVAETSDTGICTRPKLIAPFQIARAMTHCSRRLLSDDLTAAAKVQALARRTNTGPGAKKQ